jgi:hypothetical protein
MTSAPAAAGSPLPAGGAGGELGRMTPSFSQFRFAWRFLVLALAGWAAAGRLPAEIKVGAWQPLFQGIEFAAGSADGTEPRRQEVRVLRIDLRAEGIELFSTPTNGEAPKETTSETATEFLERHRLQAAINANFFSPCCSPGDKDLGGLAVSRGEVVSPPATSGLGAKVLVVTRDLRASIRETGADFRTDGVWTAVAGSDLVLRAGQVVPYEPTAFRTTPHPRSAVGISADGRYLLLLTIDGRQAGYSEGATLAEVAQWLLRFGAHDGLNLDGGGSTALVKAADGRAVLLNRPSGSSLGSIAGAGAERSQRSNGNHLGVYARPLASPAAR